MIVLKDPTDARIEKRPILRPPIPSPYAGASTPKVIYVSTKTPFVSAVKRVRKLLSLIDKRAMGKVDLVDGQGSDRQKLKTLGDKAASVKAKAPEAVILKATNRAIENLLGLALFFQGQADCRVRLKTGSVGVVDDIVEAPETGDRHLAEDGEEIVEDEDLPETQIRKISMVEVAISMK